MTDINDLHDEGAIEILARSGVAGDRSLAATHLEVSLNGGDVDTCRSIGLQLLAALEKSPAPSVLLLSRSTDDAGQLEGVGFHIANDGAEFEYGSAHTRLHLVDNASDTNRLVEAARRDWA